QVGVPLGSLLALILIAVTVSDLFRLPSAGPVLDVAIGYILDSIVGCSLGATIRHVIPNTRSTGRWVWIIPTSLFVFGFLHDSFQFSLKMAFRECFFPGRNEPWLFVLATCPTV